VSKCDFFGWQLKQLKFCSEAPRPLPFPTKDQLPFSRAITPGLY
jgi:hypothetical protein